MVAARKLTKSGCEHCPKSEDVWLEAARHYVRGLVSVNHRVPLIPRLEFHAKVILTNAVQHVDYSVKNRLATADLEHDIKAKKCMLRKCKYLISSCSTISLMGSSQDSGRRVG